MTTYEILARASGGFEVHTPGCRSIKKYVETWTEEVSSFRELVELEYSGHMYDEGSPWTDYKSEFLVHPCAKGIQES